MSIVEEEPRGSYADPRVVSLSGADQLRAFVRGDLPRPPLSYLIGLRPTEVGAGSCVWTMPVTKWLLSPQGLLYAGCMAPLIDAALGSAVQSALPPATPYTTFELSIALLRPAAVEAKTLVARSRLIFAGRSLGLAEAFVEDSLGRSLAYASSRCFIFPSGDASDPPILRRVEEPEFDSPHPYERSAEGEVLGAEVWEEKSGLQILQGHIAGDIPLPPIAHLTGLRPVEGGDGTATFRLPTSSWFCAPHGNVQGGLIALIADHGLTGAISCTIPAGGGFAALDLKINFVRPVPPQSGDLLGIGRVVSRGRRTAVATGEVVNAEGKPVAICMSSAAIVDRPVTAQRPLSSVEEQEPPETDRSH